MFHEATAQEIVQTLVAAGHVAYFAGGWVRDHLLGRPSADIDIATSASPQEVMELFEKVIPVGVEFGSLLVVQDGAQFEVTSFRTEGPYHDGRRPSSVAAGNAEADAKRRGLTINGMFYDPLTGEVIDFVGGQADLKAGIVRAIGNPVERFEEDKLRMIRALRFSNSLGFTLEAKTAEAIRQFAHQLLPAVAFERIWQEIDKMRGLPQMGAFLLALHEYGLLGQIFPDLRDVSAEDMSGRIAPLNFYPADAPTIAYLTALFPSPRPEIGVRLKTSKKQIRFAERQLKLLQLLENGPSVEWVHFYALADADLLLRIEAARHSQPEEFLQHHRGQIERFKPHIERVRSKRPLVTAAHLQRIGVAPGPGMGEMLREAERIAIESDLHDAEAILARLSAR